MLRATAKNPGMLDYLDNSLNFKRWVHLPAPSRTGSTRTTRRELLELHTVGVDAGYTPGRTGSSGARLHRLDDPDTSGPSTTSRRLRVRGSQGHDKGAKSIMGVLSLPAIAGMEDGEDVLHFLAHAPEDRRARSAASSASASSRRRRREALVQAAAATFLADRRRPARGDAHDPALAGVPRASDLCETKVKRPLVYVASLRACGRRSCDNASSSRPRWTARSRGWARRSTPRGRRPGYPDSSPVLGRARGRSWSRINLAARAAIGDNGFAPAVDVGARADPRPSSSSSCEPLRCRGSRCEPHVGGPRSRAFAGRIAGLRARASSRRRPRSS